VLSRLLESPAHPRSAEQHAIKKGHPVASFIVYKHGIKTLDVTPTGDVSHPINDNLTQIADLFDNVAYMTGPTTNGDLAIWNANGVLINGDTIPAGATGPAGAHAATGATGPAFPTSASITGGNDPTLSGAQKATDSVLSAWTTSVSAGEIFEFSITAASTLTHLQIFVTIQ
jgi:hypothetical protein